MTVLLPMWLKHMREQAKFTGQVVVGCGTNDVAALKDLLGSDPNLVIITMNPDDGGTGRITGRRIKFWKVTGEGSSRSTALTLLTRS